MINNLLTTYKMKNGNLPAYPDPLRGGEQSIVNQSPNELPSGLTKREAFAMAAMQGYLSSFAGQNVTEGPAEIAKWSLKYADALLQALEK